MRNSGVIQRQPCLKPFVSVRVAEIQENQPNTVWNYITSEANPADALTRGISPEELQLWHQGPQFLQKPESEWPDFKRSAKASNTKPDPEKKNKSKIKSNTSEMNTEGINNASIMEETQNEERLVTGQVVGNSEDTQEVLNRILALSSTYRKARRVTALAVRAIKNIVVKKNTEGPISVAELQVAEKRLNKMTLAGMDVTGKRMQNLIPFVDKDGIWKAKGGLENARDLPQELRNPIILSLFTNLWLNCCYSTTTKS